MGVDAGSAFPLQPLVDAQRLLGIALYGGAMSGLAHARAASQLLRSRRTVASASMV